MDDLAELELGWANLLDGDATNGGVPVLSLQDRPPRLYRPLADAADEFVRWAQSPHERVYTGIADLDAEMRGIAPGELCLVTGYSHSGKTLVLLEMLKANRDKNVLFYTPDEPRTLVLIKLACVTWGVNALDLERRIASDDPEAVDLLRRTATEVFPNMAVFDQTMPLSEMEKAFSEMADMWGSKPDLVVYDYLELLQGGGEDVPSKSNTIKAWGKRHDVPLLVLHQTSRSSGADGRTITISSGAFGGEQQATHIIGVRRKRFEIDYQIRELEEKMDKSSASERQMERLEMLRWEARLHQYTLTVNLVKNKRPAGGLLSEMDFEIEFGSGRLMRLGQGDLPRQFREN